MSRCSQKRGWEDQIGWKLLVPEIWAPGLLKVDLGCWVFFRFPHKHPFKKVSRILSRSPKSPVSLRFPHHRLQAALWCFQFDVEPSLLASRIGWGSKGLLDSQNGGVAFWLPFKSTRRGFPQEDTPILPELFGCMENHSTNRGL